MQAKAPYHIMGNVQIANHDSLVIEKGVTVLFKNNSGLFIDSLATLIAQGSMQDSILFIPQDSLEGWAGIHFHESGREDLLMYCRISGVRSTPGIYLYNTSATLSNCLLQYNSCDFNGGAINIEGFRSNPMLDSLLLRYNSSKEYGGAICAMRGADPYIYQCSIYNNISKNGGGIALTGYSVNGLKTYGEVRNCLIVNNSAIADGESGGWGGGILIGHNESLAKIRQNTIANNYADNNGGGIATIHQRGQAIWNNILWGNSSPEIGYDHNFYPLGVANNILSEEFPGNDNIIGDPLFQDPSLGRGASFDAQNLNWTLKTNSPAIDRGAPYTYLDKDGTAPDIGAYGALGNKPENAITSLNQIVGSQDTIYVIENLCLKDAITYEIPEGVTLVFPGTKILVNGNLSVRGDFHKKVIFTSPLGLFWEGIDFINSDESYLDNCVIKRSMDHGIEMFNSTVTLTNSEVTENYAENGAGISVGDFGNMAIDILESSITMINCIITNNLSGPPLNMGFNMGSGLSVFRYKKPPVLINNTFVNNRFSQKNNPNWPDEGAGVYFYSGGGQVQNCIIWDNDTLVSQIKSNWDIENCLIEGGFRGSENLNEDPVFLPGSYQLSGSSPGIDAGTPDTTGLNLPRTDALGNLRIWNARVDIGCFEYSAPKVEFNNVSLSQGWTWVSINLDQGSWSIYKCLSELNPQEGDYIKNQTESASYYDNFGWFGELTHLNPSEMYKIKLGRASDIDIWGVQVDIIDYPVNTTVGWNWIGHIPEENTILDDVFTGYPLTDGDYVKNQTISSTFYDNYGWFGELEELSPGDGYMLKVENAGTLTYSSNSHQFSVFSFQEKIFKSGVIVNPADFEYSGQVTAAVFVDEVNVGSADNELIAWVDGEARGIAKGLYFSPKDHWVYSLMIYSNLAEGDTVEFSFYDGASQEQISFSEQLIFAPDMIIADAEEPYELREVRANTQSLDHSITQPLTVFPNPFTYKATISFTINQPQEVVFEIIDAFGRVVDVLDLGEQPAGQNNAVWDAKKLEHGIYLVRRQNQLNNFARVVLLR